MPTKIGRFDILGQLARSSFATVYKALGVDLDSRLPGPQGRLIALTQAKPIAEVFTG